MFGRKKIENLNENQKAGTINIVGLGTEINGDLNTKGDIRIDGKITGDVKSKSKVVIGATGEVIGNIYAESAEISGKLKGNINTTEILFLKSTANLIGDVLSNKLVVENGANLSGKCQTGISHTKSIIKSNLDDTREGTIQKREATA